MDKSRTVEAVRGRWLVVLEHLAPELSPAITRVGRHVPCPVHGGRDGFRLFRDAPVSGGGVCNTCGRFRDGFKLLGWLRGWDFRMVARAIDALLGGGPAVAVQARPAPARVADDEPARRERLRDLWGRATSPETGLAYLRRRGLDVAHLPADLRGIERLAWRHEDHPPGVHPALLAMVRAVDGTPVTVHRIYDADLPVRKMMMPPVGEVTGGAVRLFPTAEQMGVAEGVETALAAAQRFSLPVWSALNATLLERVVFPGEVKRVVIFADNDTAGRKAAWRLAMRLEDEGRAIRVALPRTDGADWLDVLNGEVD